MPAARGSTAIDSRLQPSRKRGLGRGCIRFGRLFDRLGRHVVRLCPAAAFRVPGRLAHFSGTSFQKIAGRQAPTYVPYGVAKARAGLASRPARGPKEQLRPIRGQEVSYVRSLLKALRRIRGHARLSMEHSDGSISVMNVVSTLACSFWGACCDPFPNLYFTLHSGPESHPRPPLYITSNPKPGSPPLYS